MQFKRIEESAGGGQFIRLKDKESVVGVFMGEPHDFMKAWNDGDRPSFRFHINFIVKEGPTFTPKIFEQGITVYRQLEELHAEYGLDTIYVKITRNGTTKSDTTYSILPSKKQISKEELEHIKTLKLHDLSGKKKADGYNGAPFDSDEEIPF